MPRLFHQQRKVTGLLPPGVILPPPLLSSPVTHDIDRPGGEQGARASHPPLSQPNVPKRRHLLSAIPIITFV